MASVAAYDLQRGVAAGGSLMFSMQCLPLPFRHVVAVTCAALAVGVYVMAFLLFGGDSVSAPRGAPAVLDHVPLIVLVMLSLADFVLDVSPRPGALSVLAGGGVLFLLRVEPFASLASLDAALGALVLIAVRARTFRIVAGVVLVEVLVVHGGFADPAVVACVAVGVFGGRLVAAMPERFQRISGGGAGRA